MALALGDEGLVVNPKCVRRLLRQKDWEAVDSRPFRVCLVWLRPIAVARCNGSTFAPSLKMPASLAIMEVAFCPCRALACAVR